MDGEALFSAIATGLQSKRGWYLVPIFSLSASHPLKSPPFSRKSLVCLWQDEIDLLK